MEVDRLLQQVLGKQARQLTHGWKEEPRPKKARV